MHRSVDYKVPNNRSIYNTSPVPKSQEASQKIEQEEPEDQKDCCENLYSKNDTEMIDIHISKNYGRINKCEKVQNQ